MVDATHISFDASDRSYYAIIKKAVHTLALTAELPQKRIAELDIIVAEITSNLHKYASSGGELLLAHVKEPGKEYIEVIGLDNGPGIPDVARVLADGYSTTNTMGHGFGSIKRMSDEFDLYSQKGWGTIVFSRVYKTGAPTRLKKDKFSSSAIVVAKPPETTSGDGYYIKVTEQHVKILLADGLGHGPEANFAINEAVKAFKLCPHHTPTEILRYMHTCVRKTRGLVATVVVADPADKKMRIAGVGNISLKLAGPVLSKTHLAYNGIVGHNIPNTMNDQVMSFADYNQLTLCSDGMRSRWDAGKLPGILRHHQTIQAAAIYKDFARRTDDMSVVIVKFN